MAEYARVHGASVLEIVELDPAVHAAWVASGNPKASVFLPVVTDPIPAYDQTTQAVVASYLVGVTIVTRKWVIRALTPDERRKTWTSYEFLQRFTAQERAEVRSRSVSDPILADFLMLCTAAQEVVSDDPVTVQAMNYLVSIGVLTESRKNQILS